MPAAATTRCALRSAHANNGQMLCALAVAGMGINLEPDFIVAPEVAPGGGALCRCCGLCAAGNRHLRGIPEPTDLSAKVRAFVEFLAARFASGAEWAMARPAPAAKRRASRR